MYPRPGPDPAYLSAVNKLISARAAMKKHRFQRRKFEVGGENCILTVSVARAMLNCGGFNDDGKESCRWTLSGVFGRQTSATLGHLPEDSASIQTSPKT